MKAGNLVRVVLQVAVHGQDELARGVVETGRQRRGLAEVPAQLDHQHAAVHRGNLFQQLVGAVARAVVHQHQLKAVAHLLHHLLQAGIQDGDVLLFIVKGNNDRIFRHINSIDAGSLNWMHSRTAQKQMR